MCVYIYIYIYVYACIYTPNQQKLNDDNDQERYQKLAVTSASAPAEFPIWARGSRAREKGAPPPGNFTSLDFTCFCAVLARTRRLRNSPQYFLAILQWKITVSANLRNSPQNIHTNCAVKIQSPGSRDSLPPSGAKLFYGQGWPKRCLELAFNDLVIGSPFAAPLLHASGSSPSCDQPCESEIWISWPHPWCRDTEALRGLGHSGAMQSQPKTARAKQSQPQPHHYYYY